MQIAGKGSAFSHRVKRIALWTVVIFGMALFFLPYEWSKVKALWIPRATLASLNLPVVRGKCISSFVAQQSLMSGEGTAFVLYETLARLSDLDAGHTRRLVIVVDKSIPLVSQTLSLPSPLVAVYFFEGSTKWLHHCSWSYSTSILMGELNIESGKSDEVVLGVQAQIEMKGADNEKSAIQQIAFDGQVFVKSDIPSANAFVDFWREVSSRVEN